MSKHDEKRVLSSRREFLTASGAAAIGFAIMPRHVLGGPGVVAPSEKLNIAAIGVGGRHRHRNPAAGDARPPARALAR